MSFGSPSPNYLIDKSNIRFVVDSLQYFSPFIVQKTRIHPKLILWISDVKIAYRNCPMSFQWQSCKMLWINNLFVVNPNCDFGSCGSPEI